MQPDVCEILHVDKANRTLYLNVNGCMVTAICAEQRDDELCRQMKSILLKSLSSATVCVEKFDKMMIYEIILLGISGIAP